MIGSYYRLYILMYILHYFIRYTVIFLSRFTKELSKILQNSSLDVLVAEAEINLVKQTLDGLRKSCDDTFHEIFEDMTKKATLGKSNSLRLTVTSMLFGDLK